MKFSTAFSSSIILGLGITAGGQVMAASANGTATAVIVTPISIAADATQLNFGKISGVTSGGTVTVSPDGTWGATTVFVLSGSTPTPASFTVTGEPGAYYDIGLPASITVTSGTDTMTVGSITSNPTPVGMLDATTGQQTLSVGGTLNVGANQPSGTYTGTFNVTVNYN